MDKFIVMALIPIILSRSMSQKLLIIYDDDNEISLPIKIMIMIQVIVTGSIVMLSTPHMMRTNDTVDIIMDFLGFLVISDIDNWLGVFFEYCYDSIVNTNLAKEENYLVFSTDKFVRRITFSYIIGFILIEFIQN